MGTEWEGDERVKARLRKTIRKRLERPWTATRTMEVLRRCPLTIAQQLVHWAIAVSTAVLDRVIKTMSIALLLTNNLDNPKQKKSNLLSPAPPPYLWSLLGKLEGPAPPPSSKISWSFDLAWNPRDCECVTIVFYSVFFFYIHQSGVLTGLFGCSWHMAGATWNCCPSLRTFYVHHTPVNNVISFEATCVG